MKFTVLEINVNHEQESDYETAVDMSHRSITECNVRLKAETGAVLVLDETSISTNYSYLEPDFDQFEEDGATIYVNHASEDPTKESRTVRGHVECVAVLPPMSAEDWAQWEKSGSWHDDRNEMPVDVRRRLLDLEDFHDGSSGVHVHRRLKEDFVRQLIDGLPANTKPGMSFSLPVSRVEQELLERVGHANLRHEQANQRTGVENQINFNVFRAKQDIAETVEVARRRFKMR
ncbi:hypothetical protein [Xanthomonas translucens]|uniref:hypothetical protein n=1 Tax=Xanthomonas campestris pv. translucens TaxID=343 RepID=UPI00071E8E57|nr:hypothetical protein [Xanthomonas translucens]